MVNYKGNFYSSEAYNPTYNVGRLSGLMKYHNVTSAEVAAGKFLLGKISVSEMPSAAFEADLSPDEYMGFIISIYTSANVVSTISYQITWVSLNGGTEFEYYLNSASLVADMKVMYLAMPTI